MLVLQYEHLLHPILKLLHFDNIPIAKIKKGDKKLRENFLVINNDNTSSKFELLNDSLNDDNKGGITRCKCLEKDSPATEAIMDNARVFTGFVVNCFFVKNY